ncbi:MAG TPA: 2-oxoacid:acceptor oxidoreductase subunit alpha [Longimicrobiales bacterium]|nr:2-oxoacid:acceptor oxidoreductase subunit alpha [Longimicrobiales bacterium]
MATITQERADMAPASAAAERTPPQRLTQHILEIVSDSGEGAQKCGQIFGSVSAKMGNGVWTVEIIPAEIQPPPRSAPGASGNRIRIGSAPVTNWGDETNLVVAFNEQALLGRHRLDALADDAIVLIDSQWKTHADERIRAEWDAAMEEMSGKAYRFVEVPIETECLTLVENPRRGKNMFVLGLLAWIYGRDLDRIREEIAFAFRKKSEEVYQKNVDLLDLGVKWASENLDFRFEVPPMPEVEPRVVMNGNQAVALGAIASGMELIAMYPITPATSVSHGLAETFSKYGGILHQAEDEIAAAGFAIGASWSGKTAFTVTSGPGLALKTEFLGLSVMTETPLVVVDVQRGGPSTGLPTKVEQADLLAALYGQPGDSPHVVLAPATIEECFHAMITARRIAETFRMMVIVLTDANLATGVQPFRRPEPVHDWFALPPDLSPVPDGLRPFDWDPDTGLSRRFIPGQPGGMHTTTGLAHDEASRVAYDTATNQRSSTMRSRKLAVLHSTMKPPAVYGPDSGDMLVVGWGSTKGAIEEAVDRAQADGLAVSSLHLRFLSPMEPGLRPIFDRFRKVMTVEINYSDDLGDPYITEENRRRGQLAWLLRAQTLTDVDCWTRVLGEPMRPGAILRAIRSHMPAQTTPKKGGAA